MSIPSHDTIRDFLAGLGAGFSRAFGAPHETPKTAPLPGGHRSVVLVRDGYKLAELRGEVHDTNTHVFADLASMGRWLARHAPAFSTHVLLGATKAVAAVPVPGALVPRFSRVSCPLNAHPRLTRWVGACARKLDQRELHHLILSALEDFAPIKGEAPQGPLIAANVARVEVAAKGSMKTELDERGMITFSGNDQSRQVVGRLPPRFRIRVPWLVGVRAVAVDPETKVAVVGDEVSYEIEVHLRMAMSDAGPLFSLSIPEYEVVKHRAWQDGAVWLQHVLDTHAGGFLVGLGEVDTTTNEL